MPEGKRFKGFQGPNYTQVPDELFDELMADLGGAELKVLLYVMRRTFGFKKGSDRISKSQLENGIQRKNGDALDYGTGLSRRAIRLAVDSLVARNILLKHRHASTKNGDETTEYALNVIGYDPWVKSTHGGVDTTPGPGYGVPTQQTGLQETVVKNVNVTRNTSPKRTPTGAAISETALTKTYGLTDEQINKVRRLVDQQADVLGHRERNHASYVQRAAEAVRDGLDGTLESALGDVKDTSHRKAIGSLPAYFARVYEAMRAEATRPRLDFTATRSRRGERTDEPTSAGDVMRSQRDRLVASITAQGYRLPPHLKDASATAIAAWYDQAQRTPPHR